MRRLLRMIPLLLGAAGVCGCLPEERIVWSPAGNHALVRGPDRLYLAGADGQIHPILDARVAHVGWRGEAGFVAVRVVDVTTWKDLQGYLAEPQREKIQLTAELLLAQLQAQKGEVEDFEPMVRGDLLSALLYIRDNAWDRLPQPLREKAEKEGGLPLIRPVYALEAYELTDGEARRTAQLATTLDDVRAVRLSPDGKVLAFISAKADADERKPLVLKVMPAEPGAHPLTVAEGVGPSVAWSPGGDRLAYCLGRVAEGSETALWTVFQARLRDAAGKLLAKPDAAPQALVLAPSVDLTWLPDGRLAFVSEQVGIPAPADEPAPVNLFTLKAGGEKPQPVCGAEQASGLVRPMA
ncbi:MAG TPA: hypothetical protein VFJ30_17515, partial [Phycisphaerae bacterium]|nr:hypothetical protein [Phycisphaerae bacterium]